MVTQQLERILFHHIIRNQQYFDTVSAKFFSDQVIKKIVPLIKEFTDKYHEIPTQPQLSEIIRIKNLEEEITGGQIEALWDINLESYEEDWLRENTEMFIEFQNLQHSVQDAVTYMKTTPINVENIHEVVDKVKDIISSRNQLDFKFDTGSNFYDAEKHRQLTYNTFSSGYPFIDMVGNGGFAAKTLTVFLGQPKVGKSTWLGNIAAKAVLNGHNTAVITLEMDEPKYIKRLGANLLNIKVEDYKNLDLDVVRQRLKNLSGNGGLTLPGQFYIKEFPTSTASVNDIEGWLKKMEGILGQKFKVVVIDYLNILKNWRNPNGDNLYMKIKQIAEDMRAMGQRNGWAIVTATQTKQAFFDSNDLTLSSASESSALIATVDNMYGIIRTPDMYLDRKYKLKNLAGRDEGYMNAVKYYDIDYTYMRISEDASPVITDELFNNPTPASSHSRR